MTNSSDYKDTVYAGGYTVTECRHGDVFIQDPITLGTVNFRSKDAYCRFIMAASADLPEQYKQEIANAITLTLQLLADAKAKHEKTK